MEHNSSVVETIMVHEEDRAPKKSSMKIYEVRWSLKTHGVRNLKDVYEELECGDLQRRKLMEAHEV